MSFISVTEILFEPTFPCSFKTSGATWNVWSQVEFKERNKNKNRADLVNKLNNRAVLQLGARITEFLQSNESRIRVTKYAMPVTVSLMRRATI